MIELKIDLKETIKVKYHEDYKGRKITPLKWMENGDFVDLRCAEDVELKKGQFALISLGVSIELPKGYYATVVPRSSTFKNFGIIMANSVGIIDESYNGDNDIWKFPAYALEDTTIKFDDRIAQFTIHKKEHFYISEVEHLDNKDRGGIGSSGIK